MLKRIKQEHAEHFTQKARWNGRKDEELQKAELMQ